MKKILVVITVILFSVSGFAQMSGGVYFGPNVAWFGVDTKNQQNDGARVGYQFGAWMDKKITDNFLFNLAVEYQNLGGTLSYPYGAQIDLYDVGSVKNIKPTENIDYKLEYVSIPIGFKGKTKEIGYMSYFMNAGVAPMFRIKAKADVPGDSDDLITNNVNMFTLNWYMGAGFEWTLAGTTRLVTEISYNGGIGRLVDNKDELTVDVYDQNNGLRDHQGHINFISLKVGILF